MPVTALEYESFLESWRGVPYRDGGNSRQGVDCVRFVATCLNWLHGRELDADMPPLLPPNIVQHDARAGARVVRWFLESYANTTIPVPTTETAADYDLRPGDVITVLMGRQESHVLIAGARRNEVWHAANGCGLPGRGAVVPTSLGWCVMRGIRTIWRPSYVSLEPIA